ncbi:hypothetical protein DFH09DRAFT_1439341, partial [Mycena vulgaris]
MFRAFLSFRRRILSRRRGGSAPSILIQRLLSTQFLHFGLATRNLRCSNPVHQARYARHPPPAAPSHQARALHTTASRPADAPPHSHAPFQTSVITAAGARAPTSRPRPFARVRRGYRNRPNAPYLAARRCAVRAAPVCHSPSFPASEALFRQRHCGLDSASATSCCTLHSPPGAAPPRLLASYALLEH